MGSYPITLDLEGRRCMVVGGGRIALRKVIGLLRAGATTAVVAPGFHRHFRRLSANLIMIGRPFSESDITPGLALVIGATDDPSVNKAISVKAAVLGIPCNIVDNPPLCSFTVPAIVRRGDLSIAISTGGKSPRLSRYVKEKIGRTIGPDYARLVSYLARIRATVRSRIASPRSRHLLWEKLFDADPVEYIHRHGWDAFCARAERIIEDHQREEGTA